MVLLQCVRKDALLPVQFEVQSQDYSWWITACLVIAANHRTRYPDQIIQFIGVTSSHDAPQVTTASLVHAQVLVHLHINILSKGRHGPRSPHLPCEVEPGLSGLIHIQQQMIPPRPLDKKSSTSALSSSSCPSLIHPTMEESSQCSCRWHDSELCWESEL